MSQQQTTTTTTTLRSSDLTGTVTNVRRSERIQQRNLAKASIISAPIEKPTLKRPAQTKSRVKRKLNDAASVDKKSPTSKSSPMPSHPVKLTRWDLDDCTCSICIDILVEPVALPCKHEFCMSCIFNSINILQKCPLCRQIVPDSILREKNRAKLINQRRWCEIKTAFAAEIKNKSDGISAKLLLNDSLKVPSPTTPSTFRLSEPGEINREYLQTLWQMTMGTRERGTSQSGIYSEFAQSRVNIGN